MSTLGLVSPGRGPRALAVVAVAGFLVCYLTTLVADLVGAELVSGLAFAVLMPWLIMLVATVFWLPYRRSERAVVIALLVATVLGWGGDLTPAFLPKLALFGIGHIAYVVAWWPWRRFGLIGRPVSRWCAIGLYGMVAVTVVAWLAPSTGAMIIPVALYAAVLATMAVLASGAGLRAAVGGALFMVSDSVLALSVFDVVRIPQSDLVVVATYGAAQLLVVTGSRRTLLAPSRGL